MPSILTTGPHVDGDAAVTFKLAQRGVAFVGLLFVVEDDQPDIVDKPDLLFVSLNLSGSCPAAIGRPMPVKSERRGLLATTGWQTSGIGRSQRGSPAAGHDYSVRKRFLSI